MNTNPIDIVTPKWPHSFRKQSLRTIDDYSYQYPENLHETFSPNSCPRCQASSALRYQSASPDTSSPKFSLTPTRRLVYSLEETGRRRPGAPVSPIRDSSSARSDSYFTHTPDSIGIEDNFHYDVSNDADYDMAASPRFRGSHMYEDAVHAISPTNIEGSIFDFPRTGGVITSTPRHPARFSPAGSTDSPLHSEGIRHQRGTFQITPFQVSEVSPQATTSPVKNLSGWDGGQTSPPRISRFINFYDKTPGVPSQTIRSSPRRNLFGSASGSSSLYAADPAANRPESIKEIPIPQTYYSPWEWEQNF